MCRASSRVLALTRLALQTLGSFDFGSMRLLDFVRDHVTLFLDDPDVSVRRAGGCCRRQSAAPGSQPPPGVSWEHNPESGIAAAAALLWTACMRRHL